MDHRSTLVLTRDIAARRWLFLAATVASLFVLCRGWSWAVALAIPLVCAGVILHFYSREALDRWLRGGHLIAVDLMLATLAIVGTERPSAFALTGLFGVLGLSMLSGDRTRGALAGGGLVGCLAVLGVSGSLGRSGLDPIELVYVPMLMASAVHFAQLGAQLQSSRRSEAGTERNERGELWALLDITDTVTSTLDVGEVMHSIVERIGDLAKTPSCSILVAEGDAPGWYVMASKGHPEASMMELDLANYPEIRRALQTRQPVTVEDVRSDPLVEKARDVLEAQGFRSILVLPLLFGKQTLGALFLKSPDPRAFGPDVLRFCRVAACVSANALKNALLYRDITREAAGHQEAGEKLKRIVDSTPDLIVATDVDGRITEFNPGAEEMTGWTVARALGRPLPEVLGELPEPSDGDVPRDVTIARGDGETLEVSLGSAPLRDPEGGVAGRVWIGRNVSQLRRVERSLIQAERLSSLGEVVAGVAHELNNPLSGVVGYAELLRAGAVDPSQIRDLDRIVESAMRCQKIVFKLLSFARKHPAEKKYQSLNDCVAKVLDLKAYHLNSSQIRTELVLDAELPDTCFDFHQIDQVVLNLLNNAEQAVTSVKRNGTIVLRTGQENGFVYVEIEDDGPGVPESVQERMFDPFFTTKELGKGTGLGLSVSYGIVQEHDGRIDLRSTREGACFRVSLPILQGEPPVERPAVDSPPRGALADRSILVAEDDTVVLELLNRLLTGEGARVTLAQDGEEAWQRLSRGVFDLIIVDLRMPNLNGQQLYERVAAERPELLRRFVFATGDLVRQESTAFLQGLPNRIITKPLEQETVRRVLSQALAVA